MVFGHTGWRTIIVREGFDRAAMGPSRSSRKGDWVKNDRLAQCQCGQLRVRAEGPPGRISVCHCLDCQRRTGSVFGAQARFAADAVHVDGKRRLYRRKADSGNTISFYFCPQCGSTVYYQIDEDPAVTAIPLGAFADPGFPAPAFSVYEVRKHPWLQLHGDMEHID